MKRYRKKFSRPEPRAAWYYICNYANKIYFLLISLRQGRGWEIWEQSAERNYFNLKDRK